MRIGETARFIGLTPHRCWRKQGYPSEGAALAHLRSLLRSAKVKDTAYLHVYSCEYCSKWHVGRGGKRLLTTP